MQDVSAQEKERSDRKHKGLPALRLLAQVAEGGSGQCCKVRRLLLGLYSGTEWPLDLTLLRGLDAELQKAAIDIIELDWCGREIHTYLDDGDVLFLSWWHRESDQDKGE